MGHFNHNDHYHPFLLRQVPANCGRALDVGCGTGAFARLLAGRCDEVVALDRSTEILAAAAGPPNVRFVHGDVREYDLGSYDFVSCIASLHHAPFAPTARRLRAALRPGGVLAVLGLTRPTLADLPHAAVAFLPNRIRIALGPPRDDAPMPPIKDPAMTLREIRAEARELLPGARIRRHLYFRYSLIYRA
jgi:SAM-dependent methyltransferase